MSDQVRSAQNIAAALTAAGHDLATIATALLDDAVYPGLSIADLHRVLDDRRVTPELRIVDFLQIVAGTQHYTDDEIRAAFAAPSMSQVADIPLNPAYTDPSNWPENYV